MVGGKSCTDPEKKITSPADRMGERNVKELTARRPSIKGLGGGISTAELMLQEPGRSSDRKSPRGGLDQLKQKKFKLACKRDERGPKPCRPRISTNANRKEYSKRKQSKNRIANSRAEKQSEGSYL